MRPGDRGRRMFQRGKKQQSRAASSVVLCWQAACSGACGEGTVASAMQESPALAGTAWQVEDIDAGGVIDNSHITIEIPELTQIAGSGGCNRYFGSLTLGADEFRVSAAGNTRMACVPAIDEQERRFLQALLEVRRFETDGTELHLFDEEGKARIRAIAMTSDVDHAADVPAGRGRSCRWSCTNRFDCGDRSVMIVEFVGPETVEIRAPGRQARAAACTLRIGREVCG